MRRLTDADVLVWAQERFTKMRAYYLKRRSDPIVVEKARAHSRAYYSRNKEKVRLLVKAWRIKLKNDPVRYAAYVKKQHARQALRRRKKGIVLKIPRGVSTVCRACRVLKRFCNCQKVEASA